MPRWSDCVDSFWRSSDLLLRELQLPAWLTREVEKDLFLYLGAGQLSVASEIASEGALQVRSWFELLQLAFLLSPQVSTFLDTASSQIRTILPVAEQRQMASHDPRGGSVIWPATIVRRLQRGDRGRRAYVVNQTRRSLSRPENELLKGFCEFLWQLSGKWIGRGWTATVEQSGWRGQAIRQQRALQQVRGAAIYRSIPAAADIYKDMSQRAIGTLLRGRRVIYRDLGAALELWQDLFGKLQRERDGHRGGHGQAARTAAERVLLHTVFTPSPEKLFELYVLFRVIRALFGGTQAVVAAIRPGQNPVAVGTIGGAEVSVYFQGTPDHVTIGNVTPLRRELGEVLGRYGLGLGSGIPDICIETGRSDRRSALIVECKASRQKETLIDGIEQCQRYRDNWTDKAMLPISASSIRFQIVTLECTSGWQPVQASEPSRFHVEMGDQAEQFTLADARLILEPAWEAWLRAAVVDATLPS